jgi:hypothetical protein
MLVAPDWFFLISAYTHLLEGARITFPEPPVTSRPLAEAQGGGLLIYTLDLHCHWQYGR